MARRSGAGGSVAALVGVLLLAMVWLFKLEAGLLGTAWAGLRNRRTLDTTQKWRAGLSGAAGLAIPVLLLVAVATSGSGSTTSAYSATSTSNAAAAPDSSTETTATPVPPALATSTPLATHAARRSVPPRTRIAELALPGGVILPNHRVTPGAVSTAVTQANIGGTICLTGFTKTIRPPASYTTELKRQQLAAGYTYRGDLSTSDYEEDHLISLELGGSPISVKNLWPEPYAAAEGARIKDRVENELHDLVCDGQLSLRAAQSAIANNWWSAYQRYGGEASPQVWVGSYGSASSGSRSTSGSTSSSAPSGATARCNDSSYSYSQHRRGTCSHHGGVAAWINPPPS